MHCDEAPLIAELCLSWLDKAPLAPEQQQQEEEQSQSQEQEQEQSLTDRVEFVHQPKL